MVRQVPVVVGPPTKFEAATSGTTLPIPAPANRQVGDVVVLMGRTNGSSSPSDFSAPGFTRRGYPFVANDAAGRVLGFYTHVITDLASEPDTYTLTKTIADTRRVGMAFLIRGADPAALVAGNSAGWDSQQAPRVQLNSFAADITEPALLLYAWGTEITAGNATAPAITPGTAIGLVTSNADASNTSATRTVGWVGYETIQSGPTGHKNLTWSSASGASATGFVIRGLDIPTPVDPGPGFDNVYEMLRTAGVTWAHRGGSANFPEMSEYAYDQAVLAGYDALEFSAHKTSDNVWVGSHDANLNRTSETSGLPAISAMTWAQVQTYMNTLNSAGTPRPYYRLDAFLDKYTPERVCIADPKTDVGQIAAFLNLLDAHGGPSKIIVKFFGVGTGATALADAARLRGYQTWGYFYESDYTNGDMARDQSHWSILGMDIGASQAAWNAIMSYGKPVVGHIAQSQANYNTAISRGARIVQCANVTGIAAVGKQDLGHLVEYNGTDLTQVELVEWDGTYLKAIQIVEKS